MEMENPQTLAPRSADPIARDSPIPLAEKSNLRAGRMCTRSPCKFSHCNPSFRHAEEISASKKRLMIAAILSTTFMCIEVYGGIIANSLAVLIDAARLLSNIAAYAISLISLQAVGWTATPRLSYGYFRVEILGALFSVQLVWLLAGILFYEAIDRIINYRGEVQGFIMFSVAAFGLVANSLVAALLSHDGHGRRLTDDLRPIDCHGGDVEEPLVKHAEVRNVNPGNGYLHALGESIQTVGVMISGAFLWWKPEWKIIDPVCTLVFSAVALVNSVKMVRKIVDVLMESSPGEIDVKRLEKGLCELDGVVSVHEVHVWAITLGKVVLTCHVSVTLEADADDVLRKVVEYIRKEYGILHITVQIERR
ncbi:unnamed protein product [Spirodela intermedia]|uniref:Uncharacterized protein n=1 Tax=Spirodela intermedia TaxID=51605 RepID=A0A7I8L0J5_SPIIN|nr:unnamed protein product [Spirodela intermedia]